MEMELLAQNIEVTSVIASKMKLRKPIEVSRPAHLRNKGIRPGGDGIVYGDAYKQGIALLQATSGGRASLR